MPSKSVPLSVRISDDDAAFLSKLEIGDAKTPSEKLRALLASERRLRSQGHDPAGAAEMIEDLLRPARRRIRRIERETDAGSEVLRRIYDRLPDLAATALAGPQGADDADDDTAKLKSLETRALNQVLALCEDLLQVALTDRALLSENEANRRRTVAILELVELMKIAQKQL